MHFENDRKINTAVAIVAGAIAVSNLGMLVVAEGTGFLFLLVMTLLLGYVTLAAIKFRNVVEIVCGLLEASTQTYGVAAGSRRAH